jgi:hypothetical protein
MKNKIGFIMPRLIGATIIAGVATLIVTTVFKLLLGLCLLAGATTLIIRLFNKQSKRLLHYGQGEMPPFEPWTNFGNSNPVAHSIRPVAGFARRKETTIIPID